MDLHERQNNNIHDFFEETEVPLRLPAPPSENDDSSYPQETFACSNGPELLLEQNQNRLLVPCDLSLNKYHSSHDHHDIDDTNPLDEFLSDKYHQESHTSNLIFSLDADRLQSEPQAIPDEPSSSPSEDELLQIINYLIQFSNYPKSELRNGLQIRYPYYMGNAVVETLIEKFSKVKKTKEQIVKYCMRKAFKFILDLPKNKHILNNEKSETSEKFSFSKCKNRYLKKISEEKSMNNTFLQQIFGDKDFEEDYKLFLQQFEGIMLEDNERKVKFLANILTHEKDGQKKGIEVVKRLPWTHLILQKVKKISLELLKFTSKG